MYSASLYQDWLSRLTSSSATTSTTAQLEPAQYLNFPAIIGNSIHNNNTQHNHHHPDSKPLATNSNSTTVVTTAEQVHNPKIS